MPQALAAAAAAGITGGAAAASLAFAQAATVMVIGEVINSFTAADPPNENSKLPGTQLMFTAPDAAREGVYGRTRKSGPLLYQATSGEDKEYLHLVIALASHEVEEIGKAYFDGVPEHELIHTHDPQRATVRWTPNPNDGKGDEEGETAENVTVVIDGQSFSGPVDDVADDITASDMQLTARVSRSPFYKNNSLAVVTLEIQAASVARSLFHVDRASNGAGIYSYRSTIDQGEIGTAAFAITRHTGSTTQAADAGLVEAFGNGRKARVALRWDSDRTGINLTLQGQTLVGKIDDIQRLIETSSFAAAISVRKQDDAELVLEHQTPGESIEFSSTNSDFNHEWLDAPLPIWTTAHRLQGIAYAHVTLARRSEIWGNNVPQIAFDIKGKKDIYDPRSSTTGYTDNWALCVRDYLINYMQVPASRINDTAVGLAATVADERVELDASGETQARYTLNGTFTEAEKPGDVLAAMSQHGGWIIRRYGIWQPLAFGAQAPVAELTTADVVGLPSVQLGHDSTQLFNTVNGTWSGAESEYNETPAPVVTSDYYTDQDNGKTLPTSVRFRFADDSIRAQRLGKIVLERHRQQITITQTVKAHRLDCDVGAVVPITNAKYGWHQKLFFVADATAHTPQSGDYSTDAPTTGGGRTLVLREYAAAMFSWNHGEATRYDLAANTTLNPSRYVEAPRDFGVSTSPGWYLQHSNNLELATFVASWRPPLGGNISHYQLQWRTALLPQWNDLPDTRATSVTHGPISDTSPIDVRVRALAAGGRASRWVTVTNIPVTSVATLTGGDGAVAITKSVAAPSNPDTNDIWLQQQTDTGPIVAKYYWDGTQWADISGSAIATAIANAFEAKDVADGKAELFVFESTINPKPVGTGVGDLWIQPDTRRVMYWHGSGWEVSSSQAWDDIFGEKKADDLANSEGTVMNDSTFAKLREGRATWELAGGAELVNEGTDGAAVRLRNGAKIINKSPVALPVTRMMRVDISALRTTSSGILLAKLRAVTADGDLTNHTSVDIPVEFNGQTNTYSAGVAEGAVSIPGYTRGVLDVSWIDTSGGIAILDTVELKHQHAHTGESSLSTTLSAGLTRAIFQDFTAQNPHWYGYDFSADAARFGGGLEWPTGSEFQGATASLELRGSWIGQASAFTAEFEIQALCTDGNWRGASTGDDHSGAFRHHGEPNSYREPVRFTLRPDAQQPVKLRSVMTYSTRRFISAIGLHGTLQI